jgi:hypothetical protein
MNCQSKAIEPYYYKIVVKGHLDSSWSAWLDCLDMTVEAKECDQTPVTMLTDLILDQSALRGLLNKLFDLNLTVLSVNRCNPETGTNKT